MADRATWPQIVEHPRSREHAVHFYGDEDDPLGRVTDWLVPTLQRGGGGIVIATEAHAEDLRVRLRGQGLDPARLEATGRLCVLDADGTLRRFMGSRLPDAATFLRLARVLVGSVRNACGDPRAEVRAWGEMVDLLWSRGERAAAVRLELLWDEALLESDIRLLCSYRAPHDARQADDAAYRSVCTAHTFILLGKPSDDAGEVMT